MDKVVRFKQPSEMALFFQAVAELIEGGVEPEDVWFHDVSDAKVHIGFNFTVNGHEYSIAYDVGTYHYGEPYRLFNCAAWHGSGQQDICDGPPTKGTIRGIKKALEEHDKGCDWPRKGVSKMSN